MPRDVSANQHAELVKTITTPYFLIDLLLDVPLYYSTRNQVTFNGHSYQTDRRISVGGLDYSPNGAVSSNITISNLDNAISTVLLLGDHDVDVMIWTTHIDSTVVDSADAALLFSGSTNGFKIGSSSVSISLISKDLVKFSPGIIISKHDFSHLPAKGTEIRSGNTTIILN